MYFGPKCGRKVAVMKDLVAVKGPKVAVGLGWSGSEGLLGSGNPGPGGELSRQLTAGGVRGGRSAEGLAHAASIPRWGGAGEGGGTTWVLWCGGGDSETMEPFI